MMLNNCIMFHVRKKCPTLGKTNNLYLELLLKILRYEYTKLALETDRKPFSKTDYASFKTSHVFLYENNELGTFQVSLKLFLNYCSNT